MAENNIFENAKLEHNPIIKIKNFIDRQNKYRATNDKNNWRLVGYVLRLAYDKATIVTNDTLKKVVGGIPRGSFLIMVPNNFSDVKPHFTLLRVTGVSSTPLESKVQETYFEMQKKSMPELDIWTQSELQWGALDCDVLGMFYANNEDNNKLEFSGDVNNIVSPHMYEVYAPNEELLDLIVNGIVKSEFQKDIGKLRTMECQFDIDKQSSKDIDVKISMKDFMGCRTAMFGKTRLGKSNVVKLLAQNMIDVTRETKNVGQLIFDINGEYANDNPQDGNKSIYSANKDICEVYALTKRPETESKSLKLNFYETPFECMDVIKDELIGASGDYVKAFFNVAMPSIEDIKTEDQQAKNHYVRKIQIYWSILHVAGFELSNEDNFIKQIQSRGFKVKGLTSPFQAIVNMDKTNITDIKEQEEQTLSCMTTYYKKVASKLVENKEGILKKDKEDQYFDPDEIALLKFLNPGGGRSGPIKLASLKDYHDSNASDIYNNIIDSLNNGKTIILDLGNAKDSIRAFFSKSLSTKVFINQENKFVSNKLKDDYIQLYFEEAHNLFPPHSDNKDIYARFAKEGAKFHIGMVYSTQSPSTISSELLVQTENFFVGHLASTGETSAITKTQIAFDGIEEDILRARTPGFMRMLTMSHRFIIPVQAKLYDPSKVGV